jgi:peptidoglycan/xylan/chitin deacetylase (PgdA/CDA1 family)
MRFSRYVLLVILTALLAVFVVVPAQADTATPLFRVYITFEDGPSRPYTAELLDILQAADVKATFFPNGYQIPGKEDLIQRIVREGHVLGNHMWEEPGHYAGAPEDRVREGYFQSEMALRDALAATPDLLARYDAQPKLFRQPGGAARPFPPTDGVNVITYNWHVDSNDCGWFLDPDLDMSLDEQSLENVLGTPRALGGPRWNVYQHGDGAIIVFHDINRVTGRVLPIIIDELRQNGATFHTLPRPWDEIGTMPIALGQPPLEGAGVAGISLMGITAYPANVRTSPDVSAPLIAYDVEPGTPLTIVGRTSWWYQVMWEGQTGWIHRPNVTIEGPIPSLPLIDVGV